MPKYEVTHDGGDLRYGVQTDDEHVVGGPFVSYSEVEANVIAWALNQIADGRVITALIPPNDCTDGPRYAGYYCQDYDGPTDGVAP